MIISRTPFRISFFGGGTDYPIWYEKHGGSVISVTINKYCFITARFLPPFFDHKHKISYYKREEVNSISEIKHPVVRECLKSFNFSKGIEITHNADLPAQSGMGTSSTFTVGLLNSLHALNNEMVSKKQLALKAIDVEQNKLKEAVGSQDQTAAAFGGLNLINFSKNNTIEVNPIIISKERLDELQSNLMLFFTGFSRKASEIAKDQIKVTSNKISELQTITSILNEALNVLKNHKEPLDNFGKLLNETWKIKRTLTNKISNNNINEIYEAGITAGALGGKLLGAGAGGFMLFYVPKKYQKEIKKKLISKMFVPFSFEGIGSKIIYFSHH